MKFHKKDLHHFNDRSRTAKLCCQLCRTESTNSSAAAHIRQSSLLSILRRKDALRCTCKHLHRGQRTHHALYNNFHTEKCKLHPSKMGEKLWDGKNEGITLDDLRSLLDRKAY